MAHSAAASAYSDTIASENPKPEISPSSFDELIEQSLINFGWTQFLQSLLVSLAFFFDAQLSFVGIYSDSQPAWHCTNDAVCTSGADICKLPRTAWAWDGPPSKTIISQWDLECASSFVTGLPQSLFFTGSLIGGYVLATLGDSKIGRKNLLFFSCLTMSLASVIIIFSINIWIYSFLKFFSGFFRSSIGASTLVLVTEKAGQKWRFRAGMLLFCSFSVGFLSLPAIAYLNRNSSWKTLYLWTSIPAIFYSVIAQILVTESPRWLLMQGRVEEAMKILKGASPFSKLDEKDSTSTLISKFPTIAKPSSFKLNSSINELMAKTWALQRLLALMILAFGIGMVYYGMPLGLGNLGFNIYLAVLFNALLEVVSYIVTYLLENCSRRVSILAFTTISGICSILCVLVGNFMEGSNLKIGFELASFFCAVMACNVLLIYMVELFPTCVRNTSTALARQAIVCGAIVGPFLVAEGRRKNEIFSYGVFGGVIICCGFSVVFLPETKGIVLCDTMEQQEHVEDIAV